MKFTLISDHFKSIKKVDHNSFDDFQPFMYQRLDLPVFFHSIVELICMGNFYYVVIMDCLVVFRLNKMYGNYSCIVYFSPISIDNNIGKEQIVMGALLEAGFSARLTKSEVNRLNINLKSANGFLDKRFPTEIIYSVKDSIEMSGKKYKKLRKAVHLFDARGGRVEYSYGHDVTSFILDWARIKGVNYKSYINFLSSTNRSNIYFTSLYLNSELQSFMAIEKVGSFYHSVIGMNNYDAPIDMVPAWHYYACMGLPNKDTYLADGSGSRTPGLYIQKKRLQPAFEEHVYRIPAMGDVKSAVSLVRDFL